MDPTASLNHSADVSLLCRNRKGTNTMEKHIIWRGLLAGAGAGVLAFVFARLFAAPQTARAIEYEDGVGAAREAMDSAGDTPATERTSSCSPARCK